MKLSVVIVNYNVEYFLEQCLHSVHRAMQGIEGEVFVVDNNSVDGSLKMLAQKFPEVKVIANKDNVGFAKANNQAIRISTGEYVLLLNPDTVVEDDTFAKCIAFMDSHPDAGGLGVKMVDGKGQFLPESKRGLPTPSTAFYKMFGLCKLFPHSKRFARYYMGHLSDDETNEVEILAGAFMLMRRETLDKVGLLDETFSRSFGVSETTGQVYKLKNEQDSGTQNQKVEHFSVTPPSISRYYSSVSVPNDDNHVNIALQSGWYTGSTVTYYSGDTRLFNVVGGEIRPVAGKTGTAKLYTKVTGGSYPDTLQVETEVTITAAGSYEFNDVPIVKNILIPAEDSDTEEHEGEVKVYWYIINNSNTNSLKYSIDELYLSL